MLDLKTGFFGRLLSRRLFLGAGVLLSRPSAVSRARPFISPSRTSASRLWDESKHRCHRAMMHLFLNGLAASAGGGLTYLRNVLPHLSTTGVQVTAAVSPRLRREVCLALSLTS